MDAQNTLSSKDIMTRLSTLNLTLLTARRAEDSGAYSIARTALTEALAVLRGDGLIRVNLESRLAQLPAHDTLPSTALPGLLKVIQREHDLQPSN